MHIWALFAFLCFSFPPMELNSKEVAKEPHIVTQHAEKDGSRTLNIHNPLDQAIWIWLECENVISVHPIGIPPRHWSEVSLKSNDSSIPVEDNTCYISKWQVQKNGNIP